MLGWQLGTGVSGSGEVGPEESLVMGLQPGELGNWQEGVLQETHPEERRGPQPAPEGGPGSAGWAGGEQCSGQGALVRGVCCKEWRCAFQKPGWGGLEGTGWLGGG